MIMKQKTQGKEDSESEEVSFSNCEKCVFD